MPARRRRRLLERLPAASHHAGARQPSRASHGADQQRRRQPDQRGAADGAGLGRALAAGGAQPQAARRGARARRLAPEPGPLLGPAVARGAAHAGEPRVAPRLCDGCRAGRCRPLLLPFSWAQPQCTALHLPRQVETGPYPHHVFILRPSGPHDALPAELRGALRLPGQLGPGARRTAGWLPQSACLAGCCASGFCPAAAREPTAAAPPLSRLQRRAWRRCWGRQRRGRRHSRRAGSACCPVTLQSCWHHFSL